MTKYQVEFFSERDVPEQVAQDLANQEPEPTDQEWIAAGACWAAPPEWLYDTRKEAEATVARLAGIRTRIRPRAVITDGVCEFCGDEIENGPLCATEDQYHYCARARKMETERGLP